MPLAALVLMIVVVVAGVLCFLAAIVFSNPNRRPAVVPRSQTTTSPFGSYESEWDQPSVEYSRTQLRTLTNPQSGMTVTQYDHRSVTGPPDVVAHVVELLEGRADRALPMGTVPYPELGWNDSMSKDDGWPLQLDR